MDIFKCYEERFSFNGSNAEDVARIFVEGLVVFANFDQNLGEQIMCLVHSKKDLVENHDPHSFSGFRFRNRSLIDHALKDPNISRSLAGAHATNSYRDFDEHAFPSRIIFSCSNRYSGIGYPKQGEAKFFIECGGADSPRPVTLAQNNAGQWKVTGFSSLVMGVKKPASAAGDF